MIVRGDQVYRFVIHDRDTIYSEGVDRTLEGMGLTVLKTPVRAPQANAFCERVIGTVRRVLGLHDSDERTARSRYSSRVGASLQLRPATRKFGTRHSGPESQ